jgi:hypothetical protein
MKAGAVELTKPVRHQDLLDALDQDRFRREDDKAVAELRRSLDTLTLREGEVMVLVVAGLQNKHIAHEIGGDGGNGEIPSRTGDAKDAGKVIGRAGQNGRQAAALSPKVETVRDQGPITSFLLSNRFRRMDH